jgi:N-formylglutamate amidohydrolase
MAGMPATPAAWTIHRSPGPLIATAIHGGHMLRPEVAALMALSDDQRLHEEDPYTGPWACIGDSSVVVHRSRFEVDLNRPREEAVYLDPDDAWGLQVWTQPPPERLVEESRALHDQFYAALHDLLSRVQRAWGRFVVVDLHSYNHRRQGSGEPPADQADNPDVNVGTGSVDRDRWRPLVDRFIRDLARHEARGRRLDVRENVRFRGAHLVQWVNATFPDTGCALAIEVKKLFMDEHTGRLDEQAWTQIHRGLEAAAAGTRHEVRA